MKSKNVIFLGILSLLAVNGLAQKAKPKQAVNIPMQPAYFEFDTAAVEFITHHGVPAVHTKKSPAELRLKNQQFSNGTIEYDVELIRGFSGIFFRMANDWKNGDQFYFRYFGVASPDMRTAMQYAAFIDGMSIWDLTDEYQGGANLKIPGWNHVKLVVSGKQMKVYVNDMTRPALQVPALEGGLEKGGISFSGGEVMMTNLVIRPDEVENLPAGKGYVSDCNDTRYLRHWQVSPVLDFPHGKDVVPPLPAIGGKRTESSLPDSATTWRPLAAEDRGLVNLSRIYGSVANNTRRLAWLKTTIVSDSAQERVLNLGFSDEIWMFVNGQLLYVDKNNYTMPGRKFPNGRCTIENSSVRVPLQKGKNEILIALSNWFYGWGIMARLDDTEGIHLP